MIKKGEHSLSDRRTGVLSDSFDPVHRGHLQIALSALESGGLDQVAFILADSTDIPASAGWEERFMMIAAACAEDNRLIPIRFPGATDRNVAVQDLSSAVDPSLPGDRQILPRGSGLSAELMKQSSEIRTSCAGGILPDSLPVPVRELVRVRGLYGFHPLENTSARGWTDSLYTDLSAHRFAHSLSVAFTSRRLAELNGLDPVSAESAGLLHDCAKCMPAGEMRRLACEHKLTDDPRILESTSLLHSVVGAWVARTRYGVQDPDWLRAIEWHNTGYPGMSRLAMCVCLADYIEPLRKNLPRLDEIRDLSMTSLEKALLLSLETTADYVHSRGQFLHPRTTDTIDWLKSMT